MSILVGVLALALISGGLVYWYQNRYADTTTDYVPIWTPTPTPTVSPPVQASVKPVTPPVPAGCMPAAQEIMPTQFSIDDLGVTSHVMSLGNDPSGSPEAPPKDDPTGVGWWNKGPKVGSAQGHAILTIHTYRTGKALGNQLNSDTGLKPGMVVRLTDSSGKTMCYKYERAVKVWVNQYDPNSDVLYDSDGDPMAVIVICWDFNRSTEVWDSRVLFYLTPLS